MKIQILIPSIFIVLRITPALSIPVTNPCLTCPDGTISPCCTTLCCDGSIGGGTSRPDPCIYYPCGWRNTGTAGYQSYTQCTSNDNKCDTSITAYRCAVGYYGTSTNGTSGCTRCPASGGVYGTTADAGATSITACYIPSGTSFSDGSGSGTYTGNCYYTK
ncbi:MAG: hypothetical protein K2L25_01645 [Alphaproteobacteria bacterium]|nr:hypothetical protein [Alphaproteobacteria bacterium]